MFGFGNRSSTPKETRTHSRLAQQSAIWLSAAAFLVVGSVVIVGALASGGTGTSGALTAGSGSATTAPGISSGGATAGPDAHLANYVAPSIPVPNGASAAEADAIKASYQLTTVSSAEAATLAAGSLGAVVLSNLGGQATVAVPSDHTAQAAALVSGASFQANQPVSIDTTETPTPSWGLDRIDSATNTLNNQYNYDTTGSGTTLYTVDTGIASNTDFSGRVASGYSTVTDGRGTTDCNGHGTHVAGIAAGTVYGVAKQATIVPVRVLNCQGSGYMSDIVTGINWILATHTGGPAVINMSLGGSASSAVNAVVSEAVQRGFVVVVAAGNSSANACNSSPSGAPGAIAVAAANRDGSFASYSNSGPCVAVEAPGTDIVSDYLSGTATLSGTSMASPHVAGEALRILQAHPSWNAAAVLSYLDSQSPIGTVTGVPANTVNRLAVLPMSATPSSSPSASPSASPQPSASPTPSATPTPTPTPTHTSTPTPSSSPTPTPTPSATPTPTPTPTPSVTPALSSFTATRQSASVSALSWTTNVTGWVSFTITVTDTQTGRSASGVFSGSARSVTVNGLIATHTYRAVLTGVILSHGQLDRPQATVSFLAG